MSHPLYIGPLEVTELIGTKTNRVGLPEGYHVNNAFNCEDVRPWFSHSAQELEPHYPQVRPAPSCNPIISVVDRRALPGRIPQDVDPLDIPCEYLTLHKNGDLTGFPVVMEIWRMLTSRKPAAVSWI
jgi:hypothetical protein